jgi:membrane fusion protein, heavy metal efflux system
MMRLRPIPLFIALPFVSLPVGCHPSPQAQAAAEASELDPIGATVFGERALLYFEYAPILKGQPDRFLAHLSVRATGEPVRSGRVTLSIGSTTLVAEAPKRDGLFIPEGSLPEAGRFKARLVVASSQVEEELDLGEIEVQPSIEAARASQEAQAQAEPSGSVPFLMEQQWRVKLLLEEASPRALTRRLVVPAQVRTPEGAEASVSAPVSGRLLGPANSALPKTGETVEAGQLLAEVEPPLGAAEIAQLQALHLEFDLKALDIARALSEAQAQVDFSVREVERITKLRQNGLSTQQELDQAERDRRIAQSHLDSANATQRSLEQLVQQRGERPSGSAGLAVRLPLSAPLSGTVVAAAHLQGASIEPGEELFRILDTSRVWIEGRISEFDLHLLGNDLTAVATFEALPGHRVDVGGSRPLQLLPLLDPASRTAVLRCEVPNANGTIHAGMLSELELATERVEAEVVIPAEAIVIDQSLPTAYVMLRGELFQKRELELGVSDGALVQVLRGISAGERVATRGAYVVKLAALSPASFGPGHQH